MNSNWFFDDAEEVRFGAREHSKQEVSKDLKHEGL